MAEVLLVGGEKDRASGIRALLREDGHRVTWLRDVERWRAVERETSPEIVVAAVSGAEPVLSVPGRPSRGFAAPLLFVQHDIDPCFDVHMEERLVDRLESPFMAEELLGRVDALVRVRRVVRREHAEGEEPIASPSGWRGMGRRVASALTRRVPPYEKPPAPYLEVAARVADWADRRDGIEPGHAERVTSFAAMIADGLGMPDGEAARLLRAAMLHDIGKVALPVEVLRHRGPLDDEHMRLMRTHAERGARLVRALDRDESVAETILLHHERPDGTGYYSRTSSEVPLASRVLGCAEAYDAMTMTRVGTPMSSERALDRMRDTRGAQFDPDCVDALVDALRPRPRRVPLSALR